MKIVFLDALTLGKDISLDVLKQFGETVFYDTTSAQETISRIGDADIVITNKVRLFKDEIDAAKALKLICVAATGVNCVDVQYAASKGIPVKNVAGYSTESVVQTTFMHILTLVGRHGYFDSRVKDGSYAREGIFVDITLPYRELAGKKIGIIGMGTIGSRVAQIATAFGMQVSYYSTSGTSHCKEYPSLPLEQLLAESDIVSVHCPLNAATDGLIGSKQLAMMKPTAIIVNMGRGGIVVEEDLAAALREGVIAGAGLDVFVKEPLAADHPFTTLGDRISLSPHIGWASVEARIRLVNMLADNIRTFLG